MNQYNCKKWILYLWTLKTVTSEPHVLILELTDKLDLRRGEKMLLYQTSVFVTHGKT